MTDGCIGGWIDGLVELDEFVTKETGGTLWNVESNSKVVVVHLKAGDLMRLWTINLQFVG
jgi:hypothetical protein